MNIIRLLLAISLLFAAGAKTAPAATRPNILFCISDDQSYAHTGANGDPVVKTPGFDRIAREGLCFVHAFCDAPTCGPSRSAILTGQPIWRLEEAGNIHSTLPAKFATYTNHLSKAGYAVRRGPAEPRKPGQGRPAHYPLDYPGVNGRPGQGSTDSRGD